MQVKIIWNIKPTQYLSDGFQNQQIEAVFQQGLAIPVINTILARIVKMKNQDLAKPPHRGC